jgi:hypothetical protein
MSFKQSTAYKQLKTVLQGTLVLPTCSDYQESLKRWLILAEKPAGLIAFVRDESDVAAAIKFATEANLEIAIKGQSSLHCSHATCSDQSRRWP